MKLRLHASSWIAVQNSEKKMTPAVLFLWKQFSDVSDKIEVNPNAGSFKAVAICCERGRIDSTPLLGTWINFGHSSWAISKHLHHVQVAMLRRVCRFYISLTVAWHLQDGSNWRHKTYLMCIDLMSPFIYMLHLDPQLSSNTVANLDCIWSLSHCDANIKLKAPTNPETRGCVSVLLQEIFWDQKFHGKNSMQYCAADKSQLRGNTVETGIIWT